VPHLQTSPRYREYGEIRDRLAETGEDYLRDLLHIARQTFGGP
jgi:hypothetical protein